MKPNLLPLAAGALLALWMTGCSMQSSDPLPEPTLSGDVHLTILQTTDVHNNANGAGHVSATASAPQGSYARIAAYVNSVRSASNHPVVLVDSGDWSMGTYYDLTAAQQPIALYFMDALRYNCATLGNHEFDYTPAGLAQMLKAAQSSFSFHTPIVASNLDLNGNLDLVPYVGDKKAIQKTYTETLPNGLKVGYIGLVGKVAASAAPASAPVRFTDYTASNYAAVQSLVTDLRTNKGCHVVIALSHAGADKTASSGEDVNLAKAVTGIDVIASGHEHNPLASAKTIAHPTSQWNTRIICAGAYGTNVSKIELIYHTATKSSELVNSSNAAMNGSSDPAFSFIVGSTDLQLNAGMQPLLSQVFPDYSSTDLSKGLYHDSGAAAQEMVSNDKNPVLCPSGLGNLCADALRGTPNGLLVKALMMAGWNGVPGDPSFAAAVGKLQAAGVDPNFYTLGIVPTGVIRGTFAAAATSGAITFADVYNMLPLGISPDTTQAIPIGYPLISAYLELADIKKLCALQLVAQTNLTPSDYYLNFSGIAYTLKADESYVYFKHAAAAAVLNVTQKKAGAGSAAALQAMGALGSLATDQGAALLAARQAGNLYATAMVNLNDASPDMVQIATNLNVLGLVATKAASDAATNGNSLNALIVEKATAAIDAVSAFSPMDPSCVGGAMPLASGTRYRVAGDLYAILMLGAAQAQFGTTLTAYKSATGSTTLSSADMATLMGNRVNMAASGSTVQELKPWMALLLYMITPQTQGGHFANGMITNEYASSALFSDWALAPGSFGPAVMVRNAAYPFMSIAPLMGTLQALQAAP